MSKVLTDFGKVEYEPSWLEQKLEEYLISENHLLPSARGIDMSNWPNKIHLCRYLVDLLSPFDAVIYNKEAVTVQYTNSFISEDAIRQASQKGNDMAKVLTQCLGNPKYLREEVIRFILVDGIVTLRHNHQNRVTCDDKAFSVSWGGGDLSTCPCVVCNEEKKYDPEGIVLGREECIYALNAVIKEGGLF